MAFLFPFIRDRHLGSWCYKLLREANLQELFTPPLGFCCHLSCPKQTPTWSIPCMSHDCSPNCSPFPRSRKVCPRQRRPENQVLPYVVSMNLLPVLGRKLLCLKWLLWLPAAQQHPSLFPCYLWGLLCFSVICFFVCFGES